LSTTKNNFSNARWEPAISAFSRKEIISPPSGDAHQLAMPAFVVIIVYDQDCVDNAWYPEEYG